MRVMAEELKQSNQTQEEQPEPQEAEKVDNRLPYSPPTLRKHGKINNTTKSTFIEYSIDAGGFPFADFS